MVRITKREPVDSNRRSEEDNHESEVKDSEFQGSIDRRVLRSRYNAFKTLICDKRDDLSRVDSNKFCSIINMSESLHQLVQKPREQVVDAEALFDIANTLVTSVKALGDEGISPSDFVSCILRDFGQHIATNSSMEEANNSVIWRDIGASISQVFTRSPGCCTMLGPMNTELKQRKEIVRRKHVKPTDSARPEDLDRVATEEKTDTDKNMATMFDVLRTNKSVKIEHLVLNRNSFSQTVENLFALSFLVKDGRAEIKVDEKGCHLVLPKNAPAASAIAKGEVSYSHFVFRFDFKDWKLMKESSRVGDELMRNRNPDNTCQADSVSEESLGGGPTTPIRKYSRNRGLVIRSVVEDSPEHGPDISSRNTLLRRGKRKVT